MNEKHLSREQVAALIERAEPLPEEAAAHLAGCPRCLALLETQAAADAILPTHTYADDATIDRIAERSFVHLTSEERFSLHRFLSVPRIALAATAAALLVLAAYIGLGTLETDEGVRIADDTPVAHDAAPTLAGTPKEFGNGSVVEHGRARITVHRDATLSADGPDRITLARGTIELSVEKGDDFRIAVAERYLVRVLGTRFTLESDGPKLRVTVTEGLVEVIDNGANRSMALSGGMAHLFGAEVRPTTGVAAIEKAAAQPSTPAPAAEAEPSFLQHGRAALKNGDDEEAMRWFRKELSEGTEKDKALFEIVRIYEKGERFADILATMKEHRAIVDGDSAYREELLIKACKAEVKEHVGTLPACRKYLLLFPDGYKKDEIRDILENGDVR